MEVPAYIVKWYSDGLKSITEDGERQLKQVIDMLDWSGGLEELEVNRAAIAAFMQQLVYSHGSAAAAHAAEFYEVMDEAHKGRFKTAKLAEIADENRILASVHYAAGSLFNDEGTVDVLKFASRVASEFRRYVGTAANQTMVDNGTSRTRYARVITSANPCKLCEELASYGFEWAEAELVEPHDGCSCRLIAGFGENPTIEGRKSGIDISNEPAVAAGDIYGDLDDIF